MSAVLQQSKQLYRRALCLEWGFFTAILVITAFFVEGHRLISVFLGQIVGFIPHCVFVFWVFFRRTAGNSSKMTAFYRGEGLKWLCAIGLMSSVLIGCRELHYLAFFGGYLSALMANALLPIVIKLYMD